MRPKIKSKSKAKDSTYLKINEYLKKKANAPIKYEQKPSHSPSTFGSNCLRRIYYTYWKVEKDSKVDAHLARIFETGNYYEDMVMEWLKAIGEHIPYRNKGNGQTPLSKDGSGIPDPQFPIAISDWRIRKGFVDNIGVSDEKLWIYEIKSCASFKFADLDEPMPDHKIQVAAYYWAVTEALQADEYSHIPELYPDGIRRFDQIEGVKVIYINKDTSDLKIFALKESDLLSIVERIYKKVAIVDQYIDATELPPKTPDKCNYCNFRKKCDKNWNLATQPTDVKIDKIEI